MIVPAILAALPRETPLAAIRIRCCVESHPREENLFTGGAACPDKVTSAAAKHPTLATMAIDRQMRNRTRGSCMAGFSRSMDLVQGFRLSRRTGLGGAWKV